MSEEKKPENYRRRAESDWRDLPLPVRLGIVLTELRWATEEGDTEQIQILQVEADNLKQVIERLTPKPAKAQDPSLPLGFTNIRA